MALAELGETMSRAIQQMLNATIVDEKVSNEFMDEISRALLQSDVPSELVSDIQTTVKKIVNVEGDCDKQIIMTFALFNELCRILYPGNPSFTLKKGKASVIMFVGQGSEKTICTKAGAFDQLEQNAANAKIPFYESYTESDPLRVAVEGVERFQKENCDLIIVDTSGRHKQDASRFEEMRQVAEAMKPDLVIFAMDSSIGQAAAFDQARAFKQSVSVEL
ncbi:hypothetical protein Ddye_002291 [Dipteronia dyeriana]|uniref:Signal recognition particle 54 kDa protein n=1 Tax=Dipteronia dyeriana TaxID=168575 RepID=A0AAE0CU97_9ROSI|nr:hypothetical protein Ddye_002291 [Dipteronia dyeriana]